MKPSSNREASERGAVLVHVAALLVALMGMSTFVVDSGVMWTSRRQAQNAADAAALAIAISLGHDNSTNLSKTGPAYLSAEKVIEANRVWGEVPEFTISITGASAASVCPSEVTDTLKCGKVEIFRDTLHNNPLPMFFGHLIGRSSQDVKATATAIAQNPNATDCLRAFAIPDINSTGTSYTSVPDYGTPLVLKRGLPAEQGSFRFLDLVSGGGKPGVLDCAPGIRGMGDDLGVPALPGPSDLDISDAVGALIALDPGAGWNPSTKSVVQSNSAVSPRIVALPVFDPATTGPQSSLVIVNILGFFVDGYGPAPGEIHGYLVSRPALWLKSKGVVPDASSFLDKIITLVR